MLWLCLRCTQLSLDMLSRTEEKNAENALYEHATFIAREPHREQQVLNNLAHWAYHFTSTILIKEPDSLLLEVQNSLTLFKGLSQLWYSLSAGVKQRGFQHCLGLGNSTKAAWLLSFLPDIAELLTHKPYTVKAELLNHALLKVPLSNWDIEPSIKQKLSAAGLISMQQILSLPRTALGRRYGKPFLHYLLLLSGERPDPAPHWQPARHFTAEVNFLKGVSNSEQLLFPMRRLLTELCDYLRARQLHCLAFRWQCYTFKRGKETLEIKLASPKNQFDDFFNLTRLKLENWRPQAEIETLTLSSEQFSQAELINYELFNGEKHSDKPPGLLLEKLATRLEEHSYHCIDLADSHLPEATWERLPATPPDKAHRPQNKQVFPLRPTWLLPQPTLIRCRNGTLFWNGKLEVRQGPERIDSHWWQQRQRRDYFIAQHQNGAYYWIFQDIPTQNWYLQGVFS